MSFNSKKYVIATRLIVTCCLLTATAAHADVKLSGIFGDHMVLQQGQKIPVWGWADAGEEVTVNFGTQTVQTKAGVDGKWRVDLAKVEANSQPQQLKVSGKNALAFDDVLVGEVWLCSGQSNMEFGVLNIKKKEEISNTEIRVFCVTKSAALTPLDNTTFVPKELVWDTLTGHWQKGPEAGTWGGFSAVGYLFGQQIQRTTKHPVGMIGSYWGGTPAQAWTSLSGLEKNPALSNYVKGFQEMNEAQKSRFPVVWADYVAAMRKWSDEVWEPYGVELRKWEVDAKTARDQGKTEPPKPEPKGQRPANPGNVGTTTSLFNGMINPLIPYAIKGAIWYQGESNANNGAEYGVLFPNMIEDWRSKWGQGDFPFYFVQVAGYGPSTSDPSRGKWPILREGQSKALALPNTGMATAVDIGEESDIHPKNKVDVAKRLALTAENRVYGQKTVDSGPVYDSMKIEGAEVRVTFKQTGGGLVIAAPPVMAGKTPNSTPAELSGFEIAGEDQKWLPANASIEGNSVLVSSDQVTIPVAVRYAWADFPACSLYNREGLPAFPLRTDSWK